MSQKIIDQDNKRNFFLREILSNTREELEKLVNGDGDIMFDRNCLCNMGSYDLERNLEGNETFMISPHSIEFTCDNCREMTSYLDLRKKGEDNRFLYPSDSGKNVSIRRFKSPYLHFSKKESEEERVYSEDLKNYKSDVQIYSGDEFISNHINLSILNYYQEVVGFSLFPKISKSFICGKDGYCLREDPPNGKLSMYNDRDDFFSAKICKSTIFQLVSSLHFFQERNLSFSNPTVDSLSFSRRKNETLDRYMGKSVSSELSLKINDLTNAVCDSEGFRFYENFSGVVPEKVKVLRKAGDVGTFSIPYISKKKTESWNKLKRSMMSGKTAESTTISCYFYLISLFSMRGFAMACKKEEILAKVWELMWKDENDFVRISNEMKKIRQSRLCLREPSQILELISDSKLNENLMKDILNSWD